MSGMGLPILPETAPFPAEHIAVLNAVMAHASAEQRLVGAAWPGNVRELRNALERAAILAEGRLIRAEHIVLDPLSTGIDPLSGTRDQTRPERPCPAGAFLFGRAS